MINGRMLQLEKRMFEFEKRAELENWVKMDEDVDKED
jgi:hypothetical protein